MYKNCPCTLAGNVAPQDHKRIHLTCFVLIRTVAPGPGASRDSVFIHDLIGKLAARGIADRGKVFVVGSGTVFYSLTVNQLPQANHSLDALTSRYRDTATYKEKLFADKDVTEIVKVLLKRDLPEPKIPPPPAPPAAETPAPGTAQAPVPELLPDPAPAPDPAPSATPVAVTEIKLPGDTPADVLDLVVKGDRNFDQGMKHLLNSDPGSNPDGWSQENAKALDLFKKANAESYLPAQERYTKGWPQQLLDRVRETTMRIALCRKRSVRRD